MGAILAILGVLVAIYLYYLLMRFLFLSVGPTFLYGLSVLLSCAVPVIYVRALMRTFAHPGGAKNGRNWLFAAPIGLAGLMHIDLLFLVARATREIAGPVIFESTFESLLEQIVNGALVNAILVGIGAALLGDSASVPTVILISCALKSALVVLAVLGIRGLHSPVKDSRQPAFVSYFHRQAFLDLKAVVEPMARELWAVTVFAAKQIYQLSAGPQAWFIWPLTLIAYVALAVPAVIAAAATVLTIGMHSVMLGLIWALAMGVSLLMMACDRAVILARAGYAKCPHAACHQPVPLPVFLCPKCGVRHDRLIPGRCGVFVRTCLCGQRLPTLFGKNKLRSMCPEPKCGKPMREELFAENIHIPIYGGPGTGKTMFLMAATWKLMEHPAAGLDARLIEEASEQAYQRQWKPDFESGRLRDKTVQTLPNAFLIRLRRKWGLSTSLYLYDPAGEAMFQESDLDAHRFMSYYDGLALLIDPLSIRSFAERYRQRGGPDLSTSTSKADPEETLTRVVQLLERIGHASPGKGTAQRLAVIVSKADIQGFAEEVGIELKGDAVAQKWAEAGLEDSERIRHWLEENEGHLVRMIATRFRDVRFFAVSALGHGAGGAWGFTPQRVTAPLAWLLATHRTLAHPVRGRIVGRAMEAGAVLAVLTAVTAPAALVWLLVR